MLKAGRPSRISPALVSLDDLDDRMTAGLLLAVAGEAHVDRKLTGCLELAGCRQQEVELTLVIGDTAGIQPVTADLRLERSRVPQLQRIGRLDVKVAVAEHRRR
jgi:hypothetical protein